MKIQTVGSLLAKLVFGLLAFPPIYIVFKYLRWCSKQDDCHKESRENES